MKVMMIVEDRDSGFIIMDHATVPPDDGQIVDLVLKGVSFADAVSNDELLWVQTNYDKTIEIRSQPIADFIASPEFMETTYPIPSCTFFLDYAEYKAFMDN